MPFVGPKAITQFIVDCAPRHFNLGMASDAGRDGGQDPAYGRLYG